MKKYKSLFWVLILCYLSSSCSNTPESSKGPGSYKKVSGYPSTGNVEWNQFKKESDSALTNAEKQITAFKTAMI